ncbi:CadD family cadmium resistance transporter [Aerococcus sp.]|uniref:CadD family cadmium resistance transporter n=1 Tax=Aerococcus sp. TaxID=1872398 RepID=UPI0028AA7A4A|nr:CadD family cadmium resistance transporter [Aerococcus sp.]
MEIIISSMLVFISTSIDYLVVLTILFSTVNTGKQRSIYIGQYIGTGLLVGFSLIAAYFLNFIPQDWVIGLLGLLPLILGIRAIFIDEDVDEKYLEEKMSHRQSELASVVALTIALGGDNLGIYIPYFTGMSFQEVMVVFLVFIIGIFTLCYLSKRLASVPMIGEVVERYEKVIVPVVFIGLGIFILLENGTIQHLWSLIA